DGEEVERSCRITRGADGEEQLRMSLKGAGGGNDGELHRGQDPPIGSVIEVALRIGGEVAKGDRRSSLELRCQPEELVQGYRAGEDSTSAVSHADGGVHRLKNKPVPDAQRLVGRLKAELGVRVVEGASEALVEMVE